MDDIVMPRYDVTLTEDEIQELKEIIQKRWEGLPYKTCTGIVKTGQKTKQCELDI